jgi:DNA-binding NarL/FixJ family response regulator
VSAIGEMLAASPDTKVLVLSADPDTEGVLAALRGGASG